MTSPAEDHEKAIAAEYGKYVAVADIFIGGVRAFNAGDAVPTSHVERKNAPVDKKLVAGANTQAAAAVTSEKG